MVPCKHPLRLCTPCAGDCLHPGSALVLGDAGWCESGTFCIDLTNGHDDTQIFMA